MDRIYILGGGVDGGFAVCCVSGEAVVKYHPDDFTRYALKFGHIYQLRGRVADLVETTTCAHKTPVKRAQLSAYQMEMVEEVSALSIS